MTNQAPGKTKLKVTGILYIIFAALSLAIALFAMIGGGAMYVGGGETDGLLVQSLGLITGVSGIVLLAFAVFDLIVGIFGVKHCDKPEKCGVNYVFGWIEIAMALIGAVSTFMGQVDNWYAASFSVAISFLLPVFYLLGAKQNRDAARNAQ